ncbi:hypothetical protein COU56_01310 [Candidatus Pacearchaeota archaeon CG10_big_fil_rev_8_21_14_0_10_31_9]|nr:MAG: hypothetical protein COU56_01310 [Candidatus Pacearchaeota archaeon CG10_big_fil_rev_8_21_14_0_10_31_9]
MNPLEARELSSAIIRRNEKSSLASSVIGRNTETRELTVYTEFDSKIHGDCLPVDYPVEISDPSGLLTPKDNKPDYNLITTMNTHLVIKDLWEGLKKNGRRLVRIRGYFQVEGDD